MLACSPTGGRPFAVSERLRGAHCARQSHADFRHLLAGLQERDPGYIRPSDLPVATRGGGDRARALERSRRAHARKLGHFAGFNDERVSAIGFAVTRRSITSHIGWDAGDAYSR